MFSSFHKFWNVSNENTDQCYGSTWIPFDTVAKLISRALHFLRVECVMLHWFPGSGKGQQPMGQQQQQQYIYLQVLACISVTHSVLLFLFCLNITRIMNCNIWTPSRNYVRFVWQDFGGSTEDEDDDEDLKPYNLFSRQHRWDVYIYLFTLGVGRTEFTMCNL